MIDLVHLRKMAGVTQVELAQVLGISQGQVSRMERQRDMLVSTLASYLEALGVHGALVVEVAEQTVTFEFTAGKGAG